MSREERQLIKTKENYAKDTYKASEFKPEVVEAMEEAKRMAQDSDIKRYSSFKEALKNLDEE